MSIEVTTNNYLDESILKDVFALLSKKEKRREIIVKELENLSEEIELLKKISISKPKKTLLYKPKEEDEYFFEKLAGKESEIQNYLNAAFSVVQIARIFDVHKDAVFSFIVNNSLTVISIEDFNKNKKKKKKTKEII